MTKTERIAVRSAVRLAQQYWPNAHLGAETEAEDRRGAFRLIRSHIACGQHVAAAAGQIELSAYRHMDM